MNKPFVIVASAVAAIAVSVGLSAQAQNNPPSQTPAATAPAAQAAAAATPPAAQNPPPAEQPKKDEPPKASGSIDNTEGNKGEAKKDELSKEDTAKAVEILSTKCVACHAADTITTQKMDKAGWESVLGSMATNADLSQAETNLVLQYLVANYHP